MRFFNSSPLNNRIVSMPKVFSKSIHNYNTNYIKQTQSITKDHKCTYNYVYETKYCIIEIEYRILEIFHS